MSDPTRVNGHAQKPSRAKRTKLKTFEVWERVDARLAAESEQKAMESLPKGRKFELREVKT